MCLVAAAFLAAPALSQAEEALEKDLRAVIALHGMPCGEVTTVKVLGESDYAASCKESTRYQARLYLTMHGHSGV